MAQGFIPAYIAEELFRGSFEATISQINEAVSNSYAKFGAESDKSVHLVATFPGQVVVSTDEGVFYRTKYRKKSDGTISLSKVEELDVPVIKTRAETQEFLHTALDETIDHFLDGEYSEARAKASELMRMAPMFRAEDPLQEAKGNMRDMFAADKLWRRVYIEHSATIHKFLWGASGATFRYAPKPKYNELHQEGAELDEDEAGSHFNSVVSDLQLLDEKIDGLWELIESVWPEYDKQHGFFKGVELAGIAENFEQFAHDYLEELKAVSGLVQSAAKDGAEHTVVMSAVYDVVAENYPSLEVGARLIQRVAKELSD